MKVALIGNSDVSIYTYRCELIERLVSDGHNVTVVTPQGDRVSDMISMGCNYIEAQVDRHGTNPIKDVGLIKKYYRILKEIKPDIVLSYTIKPNIYASIVCSWLRIPIVVNVTGLGTAVENPGWKQIVTTMLYRVAFKKVKTVFFQNEENRQFFAEKNIANKKHKMLPGSGVNLQKFSLSEYPDDSVINFVFVSRLMQEKGIDQYLEAADHITSKYPQTKFHICGSCEDEYKQKMDKVTENPKIVYHGTVKDVSRVLQDMHCTVHPTYYPEGLSNILLESCATGRPIITTDRAGCREVVEDGVNGFVCRPKDSDDLIRQIEKFLALNNEQRRQMGLAGRRKVENEFDRQIVISKYIEVINE